MSDLYRLRVVRTTGYKEDAEPQELLSMSLPGFGSAQDMEDAYRWTVIRILAEHHIYAWQVRDEKVLFNVGTSAEAHDVIIFLAGAGAVAFAGEVVKRVVSALETLSKRIVSKDREIGDSEALALAMLHHLEVREYSKLAGFSRNDAGNRVFSFADGLDVEVDGYGTVVGGDTSELREAD